MLPMSVEELEKIRKSCKTMVKKRATVSGGAALIPIPGADIAADIGMLMELIPSISKKFGLTPDQIEEMDPKHKAMVYALMKQISADFVGQFITKKLVITALKKIGIRMSAKQVLKYIPFAGQAAAAALSFAAMMYVGNSHVEDCYKIANGAIAK